jgi:hypothetical protein
MITNSLDINLNYVLQLNNKVIGVYNNKNDLNNYINGCIQNNFFTREMILIETFINNTCCMVPYDNNNVTNNNNNNANNILLRNKVINKNTSNNKVNNNTILNNINKDIDIKSNEEYKKIQESKAELTHKINMLNITKKKIENEKNIYNIEKELYKKFKLEKSKNDTFVIPEMFEIKYKLYTELEKDNMVDDFDEYYKRWLEIKPSNNYNMFDTNSYEMSFHNDNVKNKDSTKVEESNKDNLQSNSQSILQSDSRSELLIEVMI